MPERFAGLSRCRERLRRVAFRLPLLAAMLVFSGAAACSEDLEGGAACPSLCPGRVNEFRDTILDAVVLDTTVGTFPTGGLSSELLLANRGDTLQTSAVMRFDTIRSTYRPNNDADTVDITAIDSVWIRLALDTAGDRGSTPVRIDAYDVDTTQSDSVTSVVQSLFREDRLIGGVTVVPSALGDSLRIPLDAEAVLDRVRNGGRLRVGLRMQSHGQIRIIAFILGSGAAVLSFDPAGDTVYAPVQTLPTTSPANATPEQRLAYSFYAIVDQAATAVGSDVIQIGGFPSTRAYLRFDVPRRLIDSTTIVRAELLLTQVESPFARSSDSVFVEALVPTSSTVVTDLRRVLDLAAAGSFLGLDSTKVRPSQNGLQVVNVLGLVRNWRFLPDNVPRAVGLRLQQEAADIVDVRFLSTEGASTASQRPRLRITYLPRAEFGLP